MFLRHSVHPFNGLLFRTTWILLEQQMAGWKWHQLDHTQITCTSLRTDNHASTLPLSFYKPDALPSAQPTVSNHWRKILHLTVSNNIYFNWFPSQNDKVFCSHHHEPHELVAQNLLNLIRLPTHTHAHTHARTRTHPMASSSACPQSTEILLTYITLNKKLLKAAIS